MRIGVLNLQGDSELHRNRILKFKNRMHVMLVKDPAMLDEIDGIILPGGESPTISKLLDTHGMREKLHTFIASGKPVLGTCAGFILLSRFKEQDTRVNPLGILNVTVKRNGFGRQKESFEERVNVTWGKRNAKITGVFIRAPRIIDMEKDVSVIAKLSKEPVGVIQKNVIGISFHPELSEDTDIIYKIFLSLFKK